jgi:hypothetical protein
MVCPQGLRLHLKVNLAPRSELCPLGGMFTPSFTPRGEHSLLFRRLERQTENLTPRDNFNLAPMSELCPQCGMFTPKFTPRGEHSTF